MTVQSFSKSKLTTTPLKFLMALCSRYRLAYSSHVQSRKNQGENSTVIPHAGYFKEGILNSFPDLEEHIDFLNKFYQCLVVGKMPQKVRKLVVVGPRDSGKTSWSAIFHRIVPAQRIATITKENQFSAAMMDEFMQIVLIDEWGGWCMESSLAKRLLQGGWMTTAVKHKQPRCFFNTCPFYITANELPDFGAE